MTDAHSTEPSIAPADAQPYWEIGTDGRVVLAPPAT
jgi:hypothetical protein